MAPKKRPTASTDKSSNKKAKSDAVAKAEEADDSVEESGLSNSEVSDEPQGGRKQSKAGNKRSKQSDSEKDLSDSNADSFDAPKGKNDKSKIAKTSNDSKSENDDAKPKAKAKSKGKTPVVEEGDEDESSNEKDVKSDKKGKDEEESKPKGKAPKAKAKAKGSTKGKQAPVESEESGVTDADESDAAESTAKDMKGKAKSPKAKAKGKAKAKNAAKGKPADEDTSANEEESDEDEKSKGKDLEESKAKGKGPKAKAKAKGSTMKEAEEGSGDESETDTAKGGKKPKSKAKAKAKKGKADVSDDDGENPDYDSAAFEELLGDGWHTALTDELAKPYFRTCWTSVNKARSKGKVYPPSNMVFNAYKLCPLDKVRVVIVGQDPYHQAKQAMGLCFSVPREIKAPPSLVNIFKEVGQELPHGDLTTWAEQGVFLLNTLLTVEDSTPMAHKSFGWEQFTNATLKHISSECEDVVFLLWGNPAKEKGKLIDGKKHHILEAGHPSPLSVRYFTGCEHFKKCNDFLKEKGLPEIKWELPE